MPSHVFSTSLIARRSHAWEAVGRSDKVVQRVRWGHDLEDVCDWVVSRDEERRRAARKKRQAGGASEDESEDDDEHAADAGDAEERRRQELAHRLLSPLKERAWLRGRPTTAPATSSVYEGRSNRADKERHQFREKLDVRGKLRKSHEAHLEMLPQEDSRIATMGDHAASEASFKLPVYTTVEKAKMSREAEAAANDRARAMREQIEISEHAPCTSLNYGQRIALECVTRGSSDERRFLKLELKHNTYNDGVDVTLIDRETPQWELSTAATSLEDATQFTIKNMEEDDNWFGEVGYGREVHFGEPLRLEINLTAKMREKMKQIEKEDHVKKSNKLLLGVLPFAYNLAEAKEKKPRYNAMGQKYPAAEARPVALNAKDANPRTHAGRFAGRWVLRDPSQFLVAGGKVLGEGVGAAAQIAKAKAKAKGKGHGTGKSNAEAKPVAAGKDGDSSMASGDGGEGGGGGGGSERMPTHQNPVVIDQDWGFLTGSTGEDGNNNNGVVMEVHGAPEENLARAELRLSSLWIVHLCSAQLKKGSSRRNTAMVRARTKMQQNSLLHKDYSQWPYEVNRKRQYFKQEVNRKQDEMEHTRNLSMRRRLRAGATRTLRRAAEAQEHRHTQTYSSPSRSTPQPARSRLLASCSSPEATSRGAASRSPSPVPSIGTVASRLEAFTTGSGDLSRGPSPVQSHPSRVGSRAGSPPPMMMSDHTPRRGRRRHAAGVICEDDTTVSLSRLFPQDNAAHFRNPLREMPEVAFHEPYAYDVLERAARAAVEVRLGSDLACVKHTREARRLAAARVIQHAVRRKFRFDQPYTHQFIRMEKQVRRKRREELDKERQKELAKRALQDERRRHVMKAAGSPSGRNVAARVTHRFGAHRGQRVQRRSVASQLRQLERMRSPVHKREEASAASLSPHRRRRRSPARTPSRANNNHGTSPSTPVRGALLSPAAKAALASTRGGTDLFIGGGGHDVARPATAPAGARRTPMRAASGASTGRFH